MSGDRTPSADPAPAIRAALDRQRAAYLAEPMPSLQTRLERLSRLETAVRERQEELVAAVRADFGERSRHETLGAEVFGTLSTIHWLKGHLASWMRPEARAISWLFRPGRGEVRRQPKGVVGVISPWNYPIYLALPPVATALAAGNRVILKPSELSPRTSALLEEVLSVFPDDLVRVVTGGPRTGAAFSSMPWDHLFYTGSSSVGRLVLAAASQHLVPCTLELGGKSPFIVHESYPLKLAAQRLAFGKLYNAGQTCLAPDYALIPRRHVEGFVEAVRAEVKRLYPTMRTNPDYTSIINEGQLGRLERTLEDARDKGARVVTVNPADEELRDVRKLPLSLVLDATPEMTVLQDEIFGPILPIVPYDTLDDAIRWVVERPRPLAVYYFDHERQRQRYLLDRTHSGGACINDVLLQVAQDALPFGGIGASGMGMYHGVEGLDTFSHRKAVFYQSRVNGGALLHPPYGALLDRLLKFLLR